MPCFIIPTRFMPILRVDISVSTFLPTITSLCLFRSTDPCFRYAPKKYWDFYPNDTITLAPNVHKPINAPNIAMQDVVRSWATPHGGDPLSCTYTDLCAEIYPGAPFAHGRPGITEYFPFDNSTFPEWKAKQMRQAYWASLSYTDANIGRVLDALAASPFAKNTIVALWGIDSALARQTFLSLPHFIGMFACWICTAWLTAVASIHCTALQVITDMRWGTTPNLPSRPTLNTLRTYLS